MSERDLVQAILLEFGARDGLRIWRANSGAATWRKKDGSVAGLVRFGVPGQGDIMGVLAPSGRLISIECKTATGRLSPAQRNWAAMIDKHGGLAIVARSIDDVRRALP